MAITPNKNSVLNKDSRYVNGGDTIVYPNRLGFWNRIVLPPSDDDIPFTITSEYNLRPDRLARDLYGKATYMWVILQYNNIVDINEEFVTGAQLKLPTFQRLSLAILIKKSGGVTA